MRGLWDPWRDAWITSEINALKDGFLKPESVMKLKRRLFLRRKIRKPKKWGKKQAKKRLFKESLFHSTILYGFIVVDLKPL